MKKFLSPLFLVIAILLCLLYVNEKSCHSDKQVIQQTSDTITIVKERVRVDTLYQSKLSIIRDTLMLPGRIDTVEVLKDYYTQRVLLRNFDKPDLSIELTDTLYQNQITGSKLSYRLIQRDTTIAIQNKVVFERKAAKLFAGLKLSLTDRIVLTPELFFMPKSENTLYGLGYSPSQQTFHLHFMKKINPPRLWRPKIRSPGEE